MSLLQLAYVIALRKIISSWKLELVLLLGIVLAVGLMASGVVFSDLLSDAAVHRALQKASPEEANFSVGKYYNLDDPARVSRRDSKYQQSANFVARNVGGRFDAYTRETATLFETSTFYFEGHPQLELADQVRPRGKITYMSGLAPNRINVLEGHWPYTGEYGKMATEKPLEVALEARGAVLLQLGVGDIMTVFPGARTRDWPEARVKIVAIFERTDETDEFWFDAGRTFSSTDHLYDWVPMFTTETAIFNWVGGAFPGLYADVNWFFFLDRNGVKGKDVRLIQQAVDAVKHEIGAYLGNGTTNIKLDAVLEEHADQLLLARIPLLLMLFLVSAILIYYLALVAGLIVRSRSTEISVLKSRGSGTLQLGILALVEGVVLAIPAVLLGPLLALGVSKLLGRIFFDVGVGDEIVPVALSSRAFILGLVGAIVAVFVLTVSTMITARKGIVEFRQQGARPPEIPFFHRYYLDLLALLVIGFIWWQIENRGSFLVRNLGTNELEIDFSLLIAPILGLFALGLVVLRIFPIVLAMLVRIVEPIGPAWLVQGLKRISRDPIIPGTLVVLLMLATALGVIGSAFSSTLERNQKERILYSVGADLRIDHDDNRAPALKLGLAEKVNDVAGVEHSVEIERANASLMVSGFSPKSISVLAVDTDAIADVAWYRPDFSDGDSLQELVTKMRPDDFFFNEGLPIPVDATELSIWVKPSKPNYNLVLRARLRDIDGHYFDVFMGRLITNGWQRLQAPISPSNYSQRWFGGNSLLNGVTAPYVLVSLHASNYRGGSGPGAIFLDTLTATTSEGQEILADAKTFELWEVLEDLSNPGLNALEPSETVARAESNRSMAFSWSGSSSGLRGIVPESRSDGFMPGLANQALLDEADAEIGDVLPISLSSITLPVKIVALTNYFSTLDPRKKPFLVVDLQAYNHLTNLHTRRPLGGSSELWVDVKEKTEPSSDIIQLLESRGLSVKDTQFASDLVSQRIEQPLYSAGWGGLLVLMFLALVLASASGMMLFSYTDTRERQTEFALLRTLGFSPGQLNAVVWFNLVLVVLCGIGLGTVIGQQIGSSLLPVLEVAEGGVRVVPPMVLQTNWGMLFYAYAVLFAVTLVTAIWLAWFTHKLEIQRLLRIGAV